MEEQSNIMVDTRPKNDNIFDQHSSSSIIFTLNGFEGSIEFLVYLIKKNGYDVQTVKLADITDQFLQIFYNTKGLDLDISTDFLLMATMLLEIKVRAILFGQEPDDEQEEIDDLESEIKRKVLEYELFEKEAEEMKKSETVNRFYREPKYNEDDARISIKNFNLDKLMQAYASVLFKFLKVEEEEPIKTIQKDEYTVDDKAKFIMSVLLEEKQRSFFDLFDEVYTKSEVINTFLALLQLVNKQHITICQGELFSDIIIKLSENVDIENFDLDELELEENEETEDGIS